MRESGTLLLAMAGLAAAQGPHYGPKDHISENDIDKKFCKTSHECGYGAVCERVCLWQEYTKKFVGCKIQCVKKPEYPHKKDYKYQLYPFALPNELHTPVKVPVPHYEPPPPPPKYEPKPHHPKPEPYHPPPPPKYEPPPPPPKYVPPPPPKYAKHCATDYDCGYNQHCTYGKECACKYGFHPDPHDHSRCLDLKPSYGKPPHQRDHPLPKHHPKPHHPKPYHPEPHHPEPYHPPKPRTCHNEHDCPYGEKCCYWRKCNAYNVCAVEYKCAKYC